MVAGGGTARVVTGDRYLVADLGCVGVEGIPLMCNGIVPAGSSSFAPTSGRYQYM